MTFSQSAAHGASTKHVVARSLVAEYLASEPIFVTKTVDEMLFKGYYVDMMHQLSSFSGYKILPNDTFGLQYGVSSQLYKISI